MKNRAIKIRQKKGGASDKAADNSVPPRSCGIDFVRCGGIDAIFALLFVCSPTVLTT